MPGARRDPVVDQFEGTIIRFEYQLHEIKFWTVMLAALMKFPYYKNYIK